MQSAEGQGGYTLRELREDYIYEKTAAGITVCRSPLLARPGGIDHLFTTREGGVSAGHLASLNLGLTVGDDPACVETNRGLVRGSLGGGEYVFNAQGHTDTLLAVVRGGRVDPFGDSGFIPEGGLPPGGPTADGLLTDLPGRILVAHPADCLPVLLFHPRAGAVAAVHAGWRGVLAGIIPGAVAAIRRLYGGTPGGLYAAVGPSIGRCCFETGPELPEQFRRRYGGSFDKQTESLGNGRFRMDLQGIAGLQLIGAGVDPRNISISPDCSCCKSDIFFSHRATGGRRGLGAGCITINRL